MHPLPPCIPAAVPVLQARQGLSAEKIRDGRFEAVFGQNGMDAVLAFCPDAHERDVGAKQFSQFASFARRKIGGRQIAGLEKFGQNLRIPFVMFEPVFSNEADLERVGQFDLPCASSSSAYQPHCSTGSIVALQSDRASGSWESAFFVSLSSVSTLPCQRVSGSWLIAN